MTRAPGGHTDEIAGSVSREAVGLRKVGAAALRQPRRRGAAPPPAAAAVDAGARGEDALGTRDYITRVIADVVVREDQFFYVHVTANVDTTDEIAPYIAALHAARRSATVKRKARPERFVQPVVSSGHK